MKSKKFLAILIAILSILYLFSGCGGASTGDLSAEKQQECLKNTVVFLTFEKQGNNFPEGFSESIYQMYETANHSVKNYLLKQSKSRLLMQTEILSSVDGQVIVSDKSIDYYKPRYKWINGKYNEITEHIISSCGFDVTVTSDSGVAKLIKGDKASLKAMPRLFITEISSSELIEMIQ